MKSYLITIFRNHSDIFPQHSEVFLDIKPQYWGVLLDIVRSLSVPIPSSSPAWEPDKIGSSCYSGVLYALARAGLSMVLSSVSCTGPGQHVTTKAYVFNHVHPVTITVTGSLQYCGEPKIECRSAVLSKWAAVVTEVSSSSGSFICSPGGALVVWPLTPRLI